MAFDSFVWCGEGVFLRYNVVERRWGVSGGTSTLKKVPGTTSRRPGLSRRSKCEEAGVYWMWAAPHMPAVHQRGIPFGGLSSLGDFSLVRHFRRLGGEGAFQSLQLQGVFKIALLRSV